MYSILVASTAKVHETPVGGDDVTVNPAAGAAARTRRQAPRCARGSPSASSQTLALHAGLEFNAAGARPRYRPGCRGQTGRASQSGLTGVNTMIPADQCWIVVPSRAALRKRANSP